jgi:hypothetical protein
LIVSDQNRADTLDAASDEHVAKGAFAGCVRMVSNKNVGRCYGWCKLPTGF